MRVQPEWISDEAWRKICAYWCSPEFLKKRTRAQKSRLQSDFAQNRGGSRPYGQTKQYLEKKYGPEAATDINTYCCMKSGVNNCDSNGKSGPIPTEKAQRMTILLLFKLSVQMTLSNLRVMDSLMLMSCTKVVGVDWLMGVCQ